MRFAIRLFVVGVLAAVSAKSLSANQNSERSVRAVTIDEFSMRGGEITMLMPHFPAESAAQVHTGDVRVEVVVDVAGKVTRTTIQEAPDSTIGAAVTSALNQWRFTPVEVGRGRDRHAVEATTVITFQFRIDRDGRPSVTRPSPPRQ